MRLEYFSELQAIEETLEQYFSPKSNYHNYIMNKCDITSLFIHTCIPQLDIDGGYMFGSRHVWNVDPIHNIIIDLTAWQFTHTTITKETFLFNSPSTLHQRDSSTMLLYEKEYADGYFHSDLDALLELHQTLHYLKKIS